MNEVLKQIKRRFICIKAYCKNGTEEINRQNLITLEVVSILTAVLIFGFIVITPVILPKWRPTIHYILFLVVMLIFMAVAYLLRQQKNAPTWAQDVARWCFMLIVAGFLTVIDTIPFPDTPQTFMGIFMTVAPVVFIVSMDDMLIFQVIGTCFFIFMALHFKTPNASGSDTFTGVFGFVTGIIIYFIVMDVRAQSFQQKELYKKTSELDALTGISNRAHIAGKIEAFLKNRNYHIPCAMILMDVDNFKQINDKLGHEKGDQVLIQVAAILTEVFKEDCILGRFGGDEFVVFVEKMEDDAVILSKCDETKDRMKNVLDGKFEITTSIGICTLHDDNANIEEMFHVSDNAMYEAKAFEKGSCVIHEFKRASIRQEDRPLMVIVDDCLIDRETLAAQFEDEYRLMKFEDGRLAKAYIEKNAKDIDIILMDLIMPGMDGLSIVKQLKSKPDTGWIPIVAVSSVSDMEEDALYAGVVDMILKPIVPAVAKIRVQHAMRNGKK